MSTVPTRALFALVVAISSVGCAAETTEPEAIDSEEELRAQDAASLTTSDVSVLFPAPTGAGAGSSGNAGSEETAVSGVREAASDSAAGASICAMTSSFGEEKSFVRPLGSMERTESTRAEGPSFSRMSETACSMDFTVNL